MLQLLDEAEEIDRGLRIEAGRGFVKNGDLRALHDDLGKAEPLAHTARERAHTLVGNVSKLHALKCAQDPALALRCRETHQPRRVGEVLGRGQVIIKPDRVR